MAAEVGVAVAALLGGATEAAAGKDEDCVATPRRCNLVLGPSGAALPLTHGLAALNRKVPKSHDTNAGVRDNTKKIRCPPEL